jgi:hypothetical protein
MLRPGARSSCASVVKNGPSTVDSVPPLATRLASASTSIETPSVSDEQNEFLPHAVAFPPGRGEKLDAGQPFVRRQLHLADERVQVLDRSC